VPRLRCFCALVFSLSILPGWLAAPAQPQGKGNSTQSSPAAQGGGSSLAGLSYAREEWTVELSTEPTGKNIRILMFCSYADPLGQHAVRVSTCSSPK
jgi:hypothetical protein